MRQQHFNIIKKALKNPLNREDHLPALKKMVYNFKSLFGESNLHEILKCQLILTEINTIL